MDFKYGMFYQFSNPETAYHGPTWYELIGLEDAKSKLSQFMKAIAKHALFDKARLTFRTSILLQGPPGTGKTTLTLSFAKKDGIDLFMLLPTSVIRANLGESGGNLTNAFAQVKEHAAKTPDRAVIFFLDEFDSFARERDDSQEVGEMKRLVNTLLTELDNLIATCKNVLVVASTNHAQNLDGAAFRRFAFQINFAIPSKELRQHLWQEFERRITLAIPGVKWELITLVDKTEGFSAADIERVVFGALLEYVYNDDDTITTSNLLHQLSFVIATSKHVELSQKRSGLLEMDDIDVRVLKGLTDAVDARTSMTKKKATKKDGKNASEN